MASEILTRIKDIAGRIRDRIGPRKPPPEIPGPPEPQPYPWEATYPDDVDWYAKIATAPVQAQLVDALGLGHLASVRTA